MNHFNPVQLRSRLAQIKGKRIAIIGDFMLDRYLCGSVSRISPEAPVPIVEIDRETEQLGGAANVANNIASLGAHPYSIGIIGNDSSGKRLLKIMQTSGFENNGIFIDESRATTIKTRVIAHDQHIVRTDRETCQPVSPKLQEHIYHHLKELMPALDGIIIEDYNKGMLSQPLLSQIIALANENNCIITVDPKFDHFFDYEQVTVFKPNRRETEQILGTRLDSIEAINEAGNKLLQRLSCQNVLITLGANGMVLFQNNGQVHRIPTQARHVHDVSGAGDTVIATLTVAMASNADILEAATLANYAAGVVVGEVGAVPITQEKLLEEIIHYQKWED